MDAILIDLENRHGQSINNLLLNVGVPIRGIVIRDLQDLYEILKQEIVAIYCFPFISEDSHQGVAHLINKLKERGAIFITAQEIEYNFLSEYCNYIADYPISGVVKIQDGYINLTGTSATSAFFLYQIYKEKN